LRKHFNLQYQALTPKGQLGPLHSLGIGFGPCSCTPETPDSECRNRFQYVRDFVGGQPVTIRECPRRFDDEALWISIRIALWEVKEWSNVLNYYGVPVVHLSPIVYNMLQMSFDARDRYHSQKAKKEG
jgi:hypothetical protein